MDNIIIVGTNHIARTSVEKIKSTFLEYKPDIIAVELDRRRLHALLTNQKPSYSPRLIKHIGVKGYLFAVIGAYLQQRMGKVVGITPGADMKQAALLARNNQLSLLLMDKDIMITLNQLSRQMTRKEKWRLFTDLTFGWMKKQEKMSIDLNKVPSEELISTLLEKLQERYPSIYKVLVDDRNKHMAQNVARLHAEKPEQKIMIVMGAGHKAGFENYLNDYLSQTKHS